MKYNVVILLVLFEDLLYNNIALGLHIHETNNSQLNLCAFTLVMRENTYNTNTS